MAEMINRQLAQMAATGFIDLTSETKAKFWKNSGLTSSDPTTGGSGRQDSCPYVELEEDNCQEELDTANSEQEDARPLKVENFGLVFMAMGASYGLAFLVFLGEIVWFNRHSVLHSSDVRSKQIQRRKSKKALNIY